MAPVTRLQAALDELDRIDFVGAPTPVQELAALRRALGRAPRLLIKRDDAIPFGFGGNKVRKLEFVAARARAAGADTLITAGGVQSNHCRATAAVAAKLGMRAIVVLNGDRPAVPRGNHLLDLMLGAEVIHVATREERVPAMRAAAAQLEEEGRTPFVIPVGASTPLGAMGFVAAMAELTTQIPAPDVIVHATSSGGTQAGLVAGCELAGCDTRVIGISADDPSEALAAQVRSIIAGMEDVIQVDGPELSSARPIHVDDRFVGDGYGISTAESMEATDLAARTEALFLDPTYTAKAMAGLIRSVREGRFREDETVLFWHTGGGPSIFR
ncbi:MAG: 1-aminocyclopropane-1-carboxylate deaminase/D-cysteine desulfhydrase [Vicinamibacterales bacterium]